jgi:hypothetical protein
MEISKYMIKALITSDFFHYFFEFTESLARLYVQRKYVDHWIIDGGVEADEQEIFSGFQKDYQSLSFERSRRGSLDGHIENQSSMDV